MLVLVLVCVLAGAAQAQAATRYVAETGDDTSNDCTTQATPCKSPQHAVGQALDNDTVEIAQGTYDITGNPLVTNDTITLRGAAAGARPVLTGTQSGLLTIGSGAIGIEVRHLKFETTSSPGGPIVSNLSPDAVFDDLEIAGGPSIGAYGFANTASTSGSVTLSDSVVNMSTNAAEGAIYQSSPAALVLRNVTASRTGAGMTISPAILVQQGRLDADGLQVSTDQARCMFIEAGAAPGQVVRNASFTQNGTSTVTNQQCLQIDRSGTYENITVNAPDSDFVAAVRVGEAPGSTATADVVMKNLDVVSRSEALYTGDITGFQLRGGSLRAGSGANGQSVIQAYDTLGVFSDVLVHAVGSSTVGFLASAGAEPEVRNITAISLGSTDALRAEGSSTIFAKNAIARAYGAGADVGTLDTGQVHLTNSNYADTDEAGLASITDFGGHQSGDPLFVNPSLLNPLLADFHVQSGSPVIDAGVLDALNGAKDFDGQARVSGLGLPDIGADEVQFSPPPPPPADDGGGGDGGTTTPPPTTTEQPPPPPPAPTPSQVVPGPVVAISASAVRVTKTGVANIRIGCPATAAGACTGTLRLQTATRVRPAQARRILQLGRRSFRIAAGRQAFVGVKLTKAARRLLRRDKRIRVKAIANVSDANGASRITQRLLSLKLR